MNRRAVPIATFKLQEIPLPFYVYPLAGALLGLIIGSFLATLVVRLPEGRSVTSGRSRCDHCDQKLAIRDLIPVVSFLFSGGQCRYCQKPIRSEHVIIELASAFVGGITLFVSPDLVGVTGAVFGWLLITLAALDADHHWLPDRLVILLATTGIGAVLVSPQPDLINRLVGGIAGFGALWLIATGYKYVRKRHGLGGGDPKMLGAIGCWLGWQALPLVLLGAALVGLAAILIAKLRGDQVTAETALPLGSFMAISAFSIWLYQTGTGGLLY